MAKRFDSNFNNPTSFQASTSGNPEGGLVRSGFGGGTMSFGSSTPPKADPVVSEPINEIDPTERIRRRAKNRKKERDDKEKEKHSIELDQKIRREFESRILFIALSIGLLVYAAFRLASSQELVRQQKQPKHPDLQRYEIVPPVRGGE